MDKTKREMARSIRKTKIAIRSLLLSTLDKYRGHENNRTTRTKIKKELTSKLVAIVPAKYICVENVSVDKDGRMTVEWVQKHRVGVVDLASNRLQKGADDGNQKVL